MAKIVKFNSKYLVSQAKFVHHVVPMRTDSGTDGHGFMQCCEWNVNI